MSSEQAAPRSLPPPAPASADFVVTSTSPAVGTTSEPPLAFDHYSQLSRSRTMGRQNESAEARERRIIADRERKRLARQNEDAAARERRMIADKERKRLMRGLETPEQKRLRRENQKKRRFERDETKGQESVADSNGGDDNASVMSGITCDAGSFAPVPPLAVADKPLLSHAPGPDAMTFKPQGSYNLPSLNALLTTSSAAPVREVVVPAGIDLSTPHMNAAMKLQEQLPKAPVCIVANEPVPGALGGQPLLFASAPQPLQKVQALQPATGATIITEMLRTDPLFTV